MADYIPEADSEFNTWQANFWAYAEANRAALELTVEQLDLLDGLKSDWEPAYSAHIAAQDAAKAATETKNGTRTDYISEIRALTGIIQANPAITDAQRESLGITVPKTSRTPAPVPTTRPVAEIDASQRLQHKVHFRNEGATSKAKPAGVSGCEVWVKVGAEPPASTAELRFLGIDTRTPYLAEFAMAEGGQTAYYMLRWVNTRGEKGPWSETVEATIQG